MNNPNESFGMRLSKLRKEHNHTQKQLGEMISEIEPNRDIAVTVCTISHWENGVKMPPIKSVLAISKIYSVSVDYLLGNVDTVEETMSPPRVVFDYSEERIEIKYEALLNYNKQPVFVEFVKSSFASQWGLIDMVRNSIILTDSKITIADKIKDSCKFYVTLPLYKLNLLNEENKPLDLSEIKYSSEVYVQSKSVDPLIKTHIDGWYQNSEGKKFLVNTANGQVLPYSGLGFSFYAYKNPIY